MTRVALAPLLQLVGLFVVVGMAVTLFELAPGASAVANVFVYAGMSAVAGVGVFLIWLGHRIRASSRPTAGEGIRTRLRP